jgi:hypothetical protein
MGHAEDFSPENPTASAGFEPATWVPEVSMLTTRPPKPLLHCYSMYIDDALAVPNVIADTLYRLNSSGNYKYCQS